MPDENKQELYCDPDSNIERLHKALCAPFAPKAVRWRAQQVYSDKALALAYVDSRDVQDRLDKVLGADRWQCDYKAIGENRVAAGIGVYLGGVLGWVWKWDGAGETAVEGEKGAFSDSFKRAAVKWGVARYLYDLGNTWVPCETAERHGNMQFKKFKEDPWNHVKMETTEIKKAMYEDLAILVGERDQGKVKLRLLQITESLGHTGIDALAKVGGRVLFDIQHEINKEVAAQLEMQEDMG